MSAPKSIKGGGADDLSIRARRFGLSLDERRLLDRACEASPSLRVSHEVGRDFDRIAVVRAGDEELIARVADRVLAASRRGSGRGRWAWGFGVAVVLLSSGALARWAAVVRLRQPVVAGDGPRSAEPRPGAPRGPAASKAREAPADEALLDSTPATPSLRDPALCDPPPSKLVVRSDSPDTKAPSYAKNGRGVPASHAAGASDAIASPDGETAPEWFRKANAARRAGDLAGAVALYDKLQAKFPNSDEARLSHVSLGKLLLSSGRAVAAERQFSLYLAVGGRELAEEALVGRAESLQRLGRAVEERQTWQRLLRDSPASVYAARAKQRIDDL